MRTDVKIDNRAITCPDASLIAGGTRKLKAGMIFTYYEPHRQHMLARSLGRITATGGEDKGTSYILAMVLAEDATFAYERWIEAKNVTRALTESPAKLAAFFFAPKLPYDAQTMRGLLASGTVFERYIDNAAALAANPDRLRAAMG